MNGTSARELYELYKAAADALRAADKALAAASPNGRDYYPQGPTALYAAQDEHSARRQSVQFALVEVDELMLHVADRL
jgi:hypothetical protein